MRNGATATVAAARLPRASSRVAATGAFAASMLFCATGLVVATHHPLQPMVGTVVFCVWVAIALRFPGVWLLVLPLVLPVLAFAPWTGWLIFDEFDLAVLGALTAGWTCLGLALSAGGRHQPSTGARGATGPVAAFLGIVSLVALLRGLSVEASSFDWFDQYVDSANAFRVGKSLLFAMALWPMLRTEVRRNASRACNRFGWGMVVGTTLVGLAVLWERAAFPGLLDFSNTYRTVALFWEMHVGGAAIDAYVVLATPFVAWALSEARSRVVWTAIALLALLTAYVCLTTFSRGAYAGVGVSIVLLSAAYGWRRFHGRTKMVVRLTLSIAGATVGALLMAGAFELFGFLGLGMVLLGLGAALLMLRRHGAMVSWRHAAALALVWGLLAEVVVVLGGGSFMRARLNASDSDLATRLTHWKRGVGVLEAPSDWLFGIGLGRLPARYAGSGSEAEFSGSVRIHSIGTGRDVVQVSAAPTSNRLSRLYALTHRVSLDTPGTYRVRLLLRVVSDTGISLDVCQQHLLYSRECQGALFVVPAGKKEWQSLTVALDGPSLDSSAWFAPRLGMFSVSVVPAGASAEFAEISLLAPDGREVLANQDFSSGMAHWFPAAQNYFLPWHIDNLYLELLIERGVSGLLAFLLLAVCALRSLACGPAREFPLSPFLAASLVGALVLGSLSSILDVPRVAFLLWLLCFFALELESVPRCKLEPRTRGVSNLG